MNVKSKYSVDKSINFWKQRAKIGKNKWTNIGYPDDMSFNHYMDNIQNRYLKRIISQITKDDKVLDVGCGTGRFSKRFSEKSGSVNGIDIVKENINLCKQLSLSDRNIDYQVMDVRKLKFSDSNFDWIFSITCLEHLTQEKELRLAIKELFRVLKTGGKLILIEDMGTRRKNCPCIISIERNKWFEMIKENGGNIIEWNSIDNVYLRQLRELIMLITRKITRKKFKRDSDTIINDKNVVKYYGKMSYLCKIIENIISYITIKLLVQPWETMRYYYRKKGNSIYTFMVIEKI